MTFGSYIKTFRKRYGLTQEELVEKLYHFDDIFFSGLDTTTLSKWERNVTRPKLAKQSRFIAFAQHYSNEALPVFSEMSEQELKDMICHSGLKNIIKGKHRDLILRLPTTLMTVETLRVRCMDTASERKETLLEIASDFRNVTHPPFTYVSPQTAHKWMTHPDNLFFHCEYKDVTTGFLFALRLTQEAYRRVLLFETSLEQLEEKDFAAHDEEACLLTYVYFALDETSAVLLLLRLYIFGIISQTSIKRVGALISREDARHFAKRVSLHPVESYCHDDYHIDSYDAPLSTLLRNEHFLRAVFDSESCDPSI